MRREDESRIGMIAGALGAMVLGIALIPLRSLTSASNLAFVFPVFTIVVAELGGRPAGLLVAGGSTCSTSRRRSSSRARCSFAAAWSWWTCRFTWRRDAGRHCPQKRR
jgi:hypothetical protein